MDEQEKKQISDELPAIEEPTEIHLEEKKTSNKLKTLLQRFDWKAFWVNFLSVVLGIVITFGVENWIRNSNEKKDIKSALRLVCDEMKDNLQQLDRVKEQIKLENRAAIYLMNHIGKFDSCHQDSMVLYCNEPLKVYQISISSEALELLKSSSLFQKIPDKELALDIIRAYKMVGTCKDNYDFYYNKKQKLLEDAMQQRAKELFASQHFTAAEMWDAFTSTVEGKQFLHELNISATYGFSYDDIATILKDFLKELDEEIEE